MFRGTQVPMETLFNHLEQGISINEFLDDSPTVTKEQVIGVLDVSIKFIAPKNAAQLHEVLRQMKI